jgi:predicted alpha/beta-fold hydrolase
MVGIELMLKLQNLLKAKSKEVEEIVEAEVELAAGLAARSAAFQPHRLLRGGRIQTFASAYPMHRAKGKLVGEQVVVVDAGDDKTGLDPNVRLMGYYNRATKEQGSNEEESEGSASSKGLVIALHGWEGNSHSPFGMSVGGRLLAEGYDLFRLNLRDHGPILHLDPYALNRGLFMGSLIDEALCAVQRVAAWAGELPVYLIGPSLGGNFVLRMALRHADQPIHNLRRVVAINPAINPVSISHRLDQQYYFRRYFRNRWLRSLMAKEQNFPGLYEFSPLFKMSYLRPMTEWLVQHYSEFPDADAYFNSYALLGDALVGLTVPTTIVTAADDPVIDIQDFDKLEPSPLLDLKLEQYGGHVGFVDLWPLRHHLPEMVLAELARE